MMHNSAKRRRLVAIVARRVSLAIMGGAMLDALAVPSASAATPVYDNIDMYTSGSGTTISPNFLYYTGAGDTFVGGIFNLATGTTDITSVSVYDVNVSGNNYTGLQENLYIYGGVNTGTVNSSNPAYSNQLTKLTGTLTGTFSNGSASLITLTLGTPLVLSTGTVIGMSVNFQGTTNGTTYASAQGLTTYISYNNSGATTSVGSNIENALFLNTGGETNGNFVEGPYMFGSNKNEDLAAEFMGDITAAPEPTSLLLVGVAAGPLAVRRRQRRRTATS